MPIHYAQDDTRRVVVITASRLLPTREERLELLERFRSADVWTYGVLYDLRQLNGEPSLAYLRELAGDVISALAGDGKRGPIAIVAPDPTLYAAACTYGALASEKYRIEVFREMGEAHHYLSQNIQRPESSSGPSVATRSILLIDDDAGIRQLVTRVLIAAGYAVTVADNGKAGLERYEAKRADLVISDLLMPDAGGLETMGALRRLNPNVKILIISGQSAKFLDLAQKFGAGEILSKPFTPDELLARVAKLLP